MMAGILILVVLFATPDFATAGLPTQRVSNVAKDAGVMYYLDLAHNAISQTVKPTDIAEAKFVQVDVAEVVNPGKFTLTFAVYYQPNGKTKIYLGSFSLYPADNPGKFIVAIQGKLNDQPEGSIVVALVMVDIFEPQVELRVGLRKISFRKM